MKIRIAEKDDIQSISRLLTDLYLELGEEQESIVFLTSDLVRTVMESKTTILIASEADQLIGLLSLTESQAIYAGGHYAVIDEMYVLPQYRSKQIGKLLIDEAIKIAKTKGWKRIDVTAPTDQDKRTVQFYEQNGFVFTGPKLKLRID